MLGEAVVPELRKSALVHPTDISTMDVTRLDMMRYIAKDFGVDAIVHLAAMTDMEECQRNPARAYEVNAGGTMNVVQVAREMGIPVLYISTAGVFDGEKEQYQIDDQPNPLSVYGKSKYAGELTVRDYPMGTVIRAGWMMGGGPAKDKKFINKITRQIVCGTEEIFVVNDKFGTPCYTYDLAQNISELLQFRAYGIFHGVCNGYGSRADVARLLVFILGLQNKVKVTEVESSYFPEYNAPRPRSERLENLHLRMRPWEKCLAEYLARFDFLSLTRDK